MLDYYEEYKKYILSFFLILSIFIVSSFYFLEDEKKVVLKSESPIQEKQISEKITVSKKESIKNNIEIQKKSKEIKQIKKEEELRKIILQSKNSNDNRYTIKLTSKKEFKTLNTDSIIIITGSISDGYTESNFPMSLHEKYIEDTSILTLEIEDKKNNIKSFCDGYFLDSLSKGFSYHIKVEFLEDISDCYVVSQSDYREEIYFSEDEKYVEMENGFKGTLAKKQIKINNKEELNKLEISKID